MAVIEEKVDVLVPAADAYRVWKRYDWFPLFMSGVESVTPLDDTHTRWVTNVGGVRREFDARIIDDVPEERLAWASVEGIQHAGVVEFRRVSERRTEMSVRLEWTPADMAEKAGAMLGADDLQVRFDLRRFRNLVEDAYGDGARDRIPHEFGSLHPPRQGT